jgi:3-oxoacyl-[acyl-carrier-protein] synthase II
MSSGRIAITGVGLITAVGSTRESTWSSLVDGRCGIGDVTLFDTAGYRSRCGAEIESFDVSGLSRYERRRWSRSDQLAVVAAGEALEDAGLRGNVVDPTRIGVLLGAGTGDLLRNEDYYFTMLDRGIGHAPPTRIHNHFTSSPTDVVATRFGFEGLRTTVVSACSSSSIAIGYAGDLIRAGRLDAAVCGGSDALSRLTFSGFNALRLMDPAPCRPFDASRAGMNIGEGAGILVLEDWERARRRGASIYAELAGYALTCEAFHATAPEPGGHAIADTIRQALATSGTPADDVDHVNAHGTATAQNDRAEARGLHRVFGERARHLPVTSIKSMVGHCLGAAGAVEAAVAALTVARGVIPPTINHTQTDGECAVDIVANSAREMPVRCVVSTSLAFGGNDAAIVFRRID